MTEPKKRRFFGGRGEVAIILVVLAVALCAMWVMNALAAPDGNVAIIAVGGREIMRINLGEYENKSETISLLEPYGVPVSFELKDGGIRFVNVDCPDHICEAMGVCKNEYDTAICLPNATVLAIYAPDDLPTIS